MKKKATRPRGRPKGRTLRELTCLRCDHMWFPRTPEPPKVCPKCKSPYWNKEKVRLTVKGRPKVSKKRVSKNGCPRNGCPKNPDAASRDRG